MKNSKLRRALLLLASAVLLVSLSVGATLAYLTAETGPVLNTFTIGKVAITLDEAEVDEYGENENGRTTAGNEYKLIPGHKYIKDPTVTVVKNSEDCFVRMIVEIQNFDKLQAVYGDDVLPQDLVEGWDNTVWVPEDMKSDGTTAICEFRYFEIVELDKDNDTVLPDLFTHIKLDGKVVTEKNIATLETVKINITAHAIQADGFDGNAAAAWTAFGEQ